MSAADGFLSIDQLEVELKGGSGVVSEYIEKVPVIGGHLMPVMNPFKPRGAHYCSN